jgi:replicative DNA helicase
METGIDSHRLRLGDVHEDEWPILLEAANNLASTAIFIDDTPAAGVIEVRTKARRLYAEHGLDMIVIDYMQLMTGPSGGRNENRQQEISYISRSLKSLARELNVPVIALSQLSRAVESRSDKRPMLSDLRESGCLTGDTRIYLPEEGVYAPLQDLVGRSDFKVLSLNAENWRLEQGVVSHAFSTGEKPVYRLTTQLGRTIRATANHPFLTIHGWKRLDELQPGDEVAGTDQRQDLNTQRLFEKVNCHQLVGHASSVTLVLSQVCQAASVTYNRLPTLTFQTGSRERAVNSAPLAQLAQSDIYWDRIASIIYDGVEQVYDLTVPGHHNFVADDILVHNSIEQDADVVLFIYREDYYVEDSDRQNIADVLVAKHRHGSTGNVSLYFRKELTQFRDLEIQRTELDY